MYRQSKSIVQNNRALSQFKLILALIASLMGLGVIGFTIIEGWSVDEALYMTVITLSTVGYGELHPLSPQGRIFTICLILLGVGVAAYSFTRVSAWIVEGELRRLRGAYRMEKKVSNLSNHIIVCGFGRLSTVVARELQMAKEPFVVIERDEEKIPLMESESIFFVKGNADDDDVLRAAGVERAKKLLAFLPADSDNTYITLSARALNPKLMIFARAETLGSENKLRRAGANEVIFPYKISGNQIAQHLIRPHVSAFLELAAGKRGPSLVIEEVVVPDNSPLVGKTLEQTDLRKKTGLFVAALISKNGEMKFNPDRNTVVESGTTMIVMGDKPSVETLIS